MTGRASVSATESNRKCRTWGTRAVRSDRNMRVKRALQARRTEIEEEGKSGYRSERECTWQGWLAEMARRPGSASKASGRGREEGVGGRGGRKEDREEKGGRAG